VSAPRAVLVDIGETLLLEEPMDRRAAAEALVADPRFAPYLPDADALEAAHAAGAERRETWTVLGWLRGMLPAELAEDAEILVWDRGVKMTPKPGAREALAALRAAKIPVGVVSNTLFSARAWRHGLERHGLAVDFVVSSADVGARKPDPRIFRAALDLLHVPAEDVWFVGDTLDKDVRGAAAVGMKPVWFGGPPAPPFSCAVARDWAQFLELWKRATERGVS
jgi:putative hydrolase of the HAD superfamily